MRLAILLCQTDTGAYAARFPDDGQKFARLLADQRPDWTFQVFDATSGDLPGALSDWDGLLLTGSISSVHDDDPWIHALGDLVRAAHAQRLPMFGACFGHQIIASALGGTVADNPTGWIFGTACTSPTAPAPWLPPQPTTLHAAHSEQVTTLPPGATSLASAPDTPHAAFGIGTHVATTQYHPEMSVEFASGLTSALKGHMPDDVLSRAAAAIGGPVDNDLWGDAIARFFETAHRDRAD